MAETPEKPCPVYVMVNGERIYCEAGPDGHDHACVGNRSQDEYRRLLKSWKESQRNAG